MQRSNFSLAPFATALGNLLPMALATPLWSVLLIAPIQQLKLLDWW
jgi:hypothetical protein